MQPHSARKPAPLNPRHPGRPRPHACRSRHCRSRPPPFPRSTRDGFACRAADLASPLRLVGQLRAGEVWTGPALEAGQAIEIMTGAPVPTGADCVLMIEHAITDGSSIRATRQLTAGESIVPAGSEARSAATLIPAGTRIAPQHIAAAAACGYAHLTVHSRPRVAILATGDELVTIESTPLTHQIRNSNSYSIAAQILAHGGQPVLFPIVRDDLAAIEDAIEQALDSICYLSGGVSMGKYDFVEQALLNLRAEFFFTGVRIQPGRPPSSGDCPRFRLKVTATSSDFPAIRSQPWSHSLSLLRRFFPRSPASPVLRSGPVSPRPACQPTFAENPASPGFCQHTLKAMSAMPGCTPYPGKAPATDRGSSDKLLPGCSGRHRRSAQRHPGLHPASLTLEPWPCYLYPVPCTLPL